MMLRRAILLAAAIPFVFVQSEKEFDVATIKPNAEKDYRFMLRYLQHGTFTANGVTLKMLIMSAYDVQAFQVSGGPSRIGTEHCGIQAKAEGSDGLMPRDQFDAMLRALPEDRFQLKARRESKEMPVYALVVAKNGPKLAPHTAGPAKPEERLRIGFGSLRFQNEGPPNLAYQLSVQLGRTVIDKTGLTGHCDFTLEWAPEPGQGGPEAFGLPPDPSLRPLPPTQIIRRSSPPSRSNSACTSIPKRARWT